MSAPINASEKEALRAISKMIKETVYPSIPESLFVNKYLEILTYNYDREDPVEIRLDSLWVKEVSGNAYNLVNVHADGNPSEILFWVPPLLRQTGFIKRPVNSPSFAEEIETANRMGEVLPRMRQQHIAKVADDRIESPDLTEDQQQWMGILRRYGKLPKGVESSATAGTNTKTEVVYGEAREF